MKFLLNICLSCSHFAFVKVTSMRYRTIAPRGSHRKALSLVYLTRPNEEDKRVLMYVLMYVLMRNCSNCPNINQMDTPFRAVGQLSGVGQCLSPTHTTHVYCCQVCAFGITIRRSLVATLAHDLVHISRTNSAFMSTVSIAIIQVCLEQLDGLDQHFLSSSY